MGVRPLLFLKEVQNELKLVTWPTRRNTLKLTVAVVVISVLVGVYIGVLDFGFTKIMALLVQK